jgi:hypothetical protein
LEASKEFANARPILQINFRSAAGDKYAFVTNVKLNPKKNGLLLRNITKNNNLVTMDDISEHKEKI